jgi:accessory gene regulator B
MLPTLSEKLSSFFVRSRIIRPEDKEIYAYSAEILLATVVNFAMLYLIAILTGRAWETTMFIVGFVPLRSLAGGYHARTHFRNDVRLFTYPLTTTFAR